LYTLLGEGGNILRKEKKVRKPRIPPVFSINSDLFSYSSRVIRIYLSRKEEKNKKEIKNLIHSLEFILNSERNAFFIEHNVPNSIRTMDNYKYSINV
jgi:hypothetical protein